MREASSIVRFLMLVGLAFVSALAAGCNAQDDYRFASQGIGTQLYSSGINQRLRLEGMYFGYLCGKAGLPSRAGGVGGLPVCSYSEFQDTHWNNMVQAGMNDIDERCDAFLAWHDERRRSGPALTGQLNTTSQFVQAIIEIYAPTALAIKVVSHAFGFAIDSLDTYNQRLLFQIDASTLQSLVITRQQNFRTDLARNKITFNGKPSVEHALRSYLRICMPMTIETEINNVLTVFDRTDGGTMRDLSSVDTTIASVLAGRAAKPEEPFKPRVIPPPPESASVEARKIIIPKQYLDRDLRDLQDALCVPDAKVGTVNVETQAKMAIFEDYVGSLEGITKDGKVTNRYEFGRATRNGPCAKSTFKNIVEREVYEDAGRVEALFEIFKEEQVPGLVIPASFTVVSMRGNIAQANSALGVALPKGAEKDEITAALMRKLKIMPQPKP